MDKSKKFDLKKLLLDNGIIVLLMILVLYVSITVPTFRSFRNLMNLAINAAPRVIIALGISACLITKGTDLSAGRVVGLSACLAGIMLQKPDAPGKVLSLIHISLLLGFFQSDYGTFRNGEWRRC